MPMIQSSCIATLVLALACGSTRAQQIDDDHTVRSILQDSDGNFWFGTWDHGVYRFDGDELVLFDHADGLTGNQVRTILEDERGTVWFETAWGVNRFDGGEIATHFNRSYQSRERWRLGPRDLWFKGDSGHGVSDLERAPGAYRFDGVTMHFHAFPLDDDPGSSAYYSVTGIDQRRDDRVWIATYGAVIGYDGQDFTVIDNASLELTDDTGYLHVRAVFEDSQGRLWIGNNGIGVIMRDGDSTVNFTQAQGVGRRDARSGAKDMTPRDGDAPAGMPSMHRVFSLGEDRHGAIWFGTIDQGAWRYDGKTLKQFTEEHGLDTREVTAIYTDADGDLWIGGKGVYRFDGETFERRH